MVSIFWFQKPFLQVDPENGFKFEIVGGVRTVQDDNLPRLHGEQAVFEETVMHADVVFQCIALELFGRRGTSAASPNILKAPPRKRF